MQPEGIHIASWTFIGFRWFEFHLLTQETYHRFVISVKDWKTTIFHLPTIVSGQIIIIPLPDPCYLGMIFLVSENMVPQIPYHHFSHKNITILVPRCVLLTQTDPLHPCQELSEIDWLSVFRPEPKTLPRGSKHWEGGRPVPNHYCGADFRGDQPKIASNNWRKRENDRCLENGKTHQPNIRKLVGC